MIWCFFSKDQFPTYYPVLSFSLNEKFPLFYPVLVLSVTPGLVLGEDSEVREQLVVPRAEGISIDRGP